MTPSVSELLKHRFNDYVGVPAAVLEAAAEIGTAMHAAIERYEKNGEESDLQEFRNYLFLKKHFKIDKLSFMQLRENVRKFVPLPVQEEQTKEFLKGALENVGKRS